MLLTPRNRLPRTKSRRYDHAQRRAANRLITCFDADVDPMKQHAPAIVQIAAALGRREVTVDLIRGEGQTLNSNDVIASPEVPDVVQAIESREICVANKSSSVCTAGNVPQRKIREVGDRLRLLRIVEVDAGSTTPLPTKLAPRASNPCPELTTVKVIRRAYVVGAALGGTSNSSLG